MWELGYECQLALWQWLYQHRSLLHYDVVVQVLCIIRPELCYMYHKSYFHEYYQYRHQQTCSKNENIIMIILLVNIYGENQQKVESKKTRERCAFCGVLMILLLAKVIQIHQSKGLPMYLFLTTTCHSLFSGFFLDGTKCWMSCLALELCLYSNNTRASLKFVLGFYLIFN